MPRRRDLPCAAHDSLFQHRDWIGPAVSRPRETIIKDKCDNSAVASPVQLPSHHHHHRCNHHHHQTQSDRARAQ
eukprot:3375853-Lingulodinium_polyedra.AAC.1